MDNASSGARAVSARVVVVGGVRLYREALAASLHNNTLFEVVCRGTGQEELAGLASQQPDLVLVDVSNTENLQLVATISHQLPGAKVVATGVSDVEHHIVRCAEAGVSAYVFADATLADLTTTIEAALNDAVFLPPLVARILLGRLAQPQPSSFLTPREIQMVDYLRLGLTNKEIARRLGLQVATVKNHMHNILQKLGVHRRAAAASAMGGPVIRGQAPK